MINTVHAFHIDGLMRGTPDGVHCAAEAVEPALHFGLTCSSTAALSTTQHL
jgi:hypothetical protein